VDLEPRDNNKSIYDLQFLCNMKTVVEAPRKKTSIVQCTRCQSYGHTKTCCTRTFVCVKCGGDHDTTVCTIHPATPATYPTNYKACDVYRRLQTARGAFAPRPRPTTPRMSAPQVDTGDVHYFSPLLHTQSLVSPSKPPPASYSHVVASGSQSVELGARLSAFLTEFKSLLNQLM
jgi:hypothetical protein